MPTFGDRPWPWLLEPSLIPQFIFQFYFLGITMKSIYTKFSVSIALLGTSVGAWAAGGCCVAGALCCIGGVMPCCM
jgi:hypothetical protein